jgi:hypothetical protein
MLSFDTEPPTPILYPVEGGEPRELPSVATGARPAGFTGDGNGFFVVRDEGGARLINRVDIRTGKETPLHRIQPIDPAGAEKPGSIQVSGDGRAYVYNLSRTLSTLFLVEGLR